MTRNCVVPPMRNSDEIYGNSVFDDQQQFTSMAHIAQHHAADLDGGEFVEDLLHVIFGMSKDFCMNGLRVGGLWTKNDTLLSAFGNLGYFAAVSAHTQWMLTQV